jgi:hypothetical protein
VEEMTFVQITNGYNTIELIIWLNNNIGRFETDWWWATVQLSDPSVFIKDPSLATLVALRWSGK